MSAATPLPQTEHETEPLRVTLLQLVEAVSDVADNEDEVVATVMYMIERGSVRLCGNFRDSRLSVD